MCVGLSTASMLLSGVGTVVSAIGAIQQGKAQATAYKSQANAAEQNQQIAEQNAEQSVERSMEEEHQHRQKVAKMKGQQKAMFGASGIDPTSGSAEDIYEETQYMGDIDAEAIRYNAQNERWGYQSQAVNFGNQANQFRSAASNAERAGRWGAFSTILGGATSVADKWYRFNN